MLIEFSVQNFRSISERQTFSMVPLRSSPLIESRAIKSPNPSIPYALSSACIFGANASGKTSLIKAMDFFIDFVEDSAKNRQDDDNIEVEPFIYHSDWKISPSEFEIVFITNDRLYQYGFIADNNKIYDEWLFERPNDSSLRTRKVFTRTLDEKTGLYEWYFNKTHLRGEREVWKSITRVNALFLSTAVQLNSEDLRHPYRWITNFFRVINDPKELYADFSGRMLMDADWKKDILDLLKNADLQFEDIEIQMSDFDAQDLPESLPGEIAEQIKEQLTGRKIIKKLETIRIDNNGKRASLSFSNESSGTQILFNLAGPLIDTIRSGYTLVIDELQNNLHPLALQYIVSLFQSETARKSGAQLIFTSHETSILNGDLIHKDQIWLSNKGEDYSTTLKPLADFNLKNITSLQKAYLDGRFGGIPIINY